MKQMDIMYVTDTECPVSACRIYGALRAKCRIEQSAFHVELEAIESLHPFR